MKKLLLITSAILILFGCQKQDQNEQIADKWNGYEKFYKAGEVYKNIIVGRNTVAGTITYGIDGNANFYATFTPNSNYQLEETYLYAGTWRDMPKSKDGDPKMSRFPLHTIHSPLANSFTYLIPLVNLPPCESPGFVVSAYAELQSTDKCGNKTPSWGGWDRRHEDKTSGGYFTYYYNAPAEPHKLFYVRKKDGCGHRETYLIDRDDNNHERRCTKISSEDVEPDVTYIGIEKDPGSSNQLQVVNPSDGSAPQLWVDPMGSIPDAPDMYNAGALQSGTVVQNATILGSDYYYIDALTQDIYQVSFSLDDNGAVVINSVAAIASIPSSLSDFTINDIAMTYDGNNKIMTVIGNSSDPNVATMYNLTIPLEGTITVSEAITPQWGDSTIGTIGGNSTISYDVNGDLYLTSSYGDNSITGKINPSTGTGNSDVTELPGGADGGIVIL